jgi:hypothetical protein
VLCGQDGSGIVYWCSILHRRLGLSDTHNSPMSQAAWFRQKADECARLAKNASELDRRDRYESQAEQWRLIAEQVEAGERIGFGSDTQQQSPTEAPSIGRLMERHKADEISTLPEGVAVLRRTKQSCRRREQGGTQGNLYVIDEAWDPFCFGPIGVHEDTCSGDDRSRCGRALGNGWRLGRACGWRCSA